MNLFYTPDIEGLEYTLSPEESKQWVRVLRFSEGEAVTLVDGKGNNKYVDIMNVHLPILDSTNHRTVKVFKRLIY